MKKAVILGERQAGLIEVPDPQPMKDWVVVKVEASALCTEYKSYLIGRELQLGGHEGAGQVVAIAQASPVNIGDRVVILPPLPCGKCALCHAGDYVYCENSYDFEKVVGNKNGLGTFGQYVLKPDWLLRPIPDSVSYEHATMAVDGIGASFGAFQTIDIGAFDTLLITGLGPVGLGAVVNACFRGTRVIGVEPVLWRRERALKMGAEVVFDPGEPDLVEKIRALTEGKGVTCALDCSGKVQSQRLCIDATRRRGRVAFVGETNDELTIRISPDMIRKGLTLVGSWLYNMADYPKVMQVIRESPLIDLLISHVMPMSQIEDGFELLASGQCAKVVVHPWG
jgi:threonine dehydrogenase-like Zn-dependent dehydrogenase